MSFSQTKTTTSANVATINIRHRVYIWPAVSASVSKDHTFPGQCHVLPGRSDVQALIQTPLSLHDAGPPAGPLSNAQVGWAINNFMLIAWSMFCYAIKIIAWRVQWRQPSIPPSPTQSPPLSNFHLLRAFHMLQWPLHLLHSLKTISLLTECI